MGIGNTVSREVREQMKLLSSEIFGASSKWQRLYKYDETVTTMVTETVPGENGAPDTTREVKVPVYVGEKVKQFKRQYRTTEEVLALLLDFKTKRDEYLANMKKMQEEALERRLAAEAAKKIQESLGGSAL